MLLNAQAISKPLSLIALLALSVLLLPFKEPAAAQDTTLTGVAIVTQTNPQALIRRKGWSSFAALELGATVQFGDLLNPKGQPIKLLCPDLTEQVITQIGPYPCPRDRSVLFQGEAALAGWQRGDSTDWTIPFLLSPRATAILTANPMIWWNAVSGVDGYRVTIRGQDFSVSKEIDGWQNNKLKYSDISDAKPLIAGRPYTIEIVSLLGGVDEMSSSREAVAGLSFTLLDEPSAAALIQSMADIRAHIKDKVLANLVVAYFAAQNKLYADALTTLTELSGDPLDAAATAQEPFQSSALLYLRLGEVFERMQFAAGANRSYAKALALAVENADSEAIALASLPLARLSTDPTARTTYATDAWKAWQKLGAKDQADLIAQEFHLTSN